MDAFAHTLPAKLDALWDFGAVAETERKFRALLDEALARADTKADAREEDAGVDAAAAALGRAYPPVLEVLTQIARTQGLQRKFDDAHATLDRVQRALAAEDAAASPLDRTAVTDHATRVNVRYLLERGRVFNSSKQIATALPLFVHAWTMAQRCAEEELAVDAAHMVAIAEPSTDQQTAWNRKAIAVAEAARDEQARKWVGSLTTNLGWTYHSAGKLEDALAMFEKALAYRERAGVAKNIVVAKWCKARCLRSLGRVDEALAIQRDLLMENDKLAAPDGYNFEEIGDLLLIKGEREEARRHFRRAMNLLSADAWFAENEKERLGRMEALARGESP